MPNPTLICRFCGVRCADCNANGCCLLRTYPGNYVGVCPQAPSRILRPYKNRKQEVTRDAEDGT